MPFAKKNMSAYEAMYEAQKIAYAPVIFQVVRSLRELGVLKLLEQSGKAGMDAAAISESLELTQYGVETLLESGHSCGVVDYKKDDNTAYKNRIYFLTKVGYYILNDVMTTTNMDFNQPHHDIMLLNRMGSPRNGHEADAICSGLVPAIKKQFSNRIKPLSNSNTQVHANCKE